MCKRVQLFEECEEFWFDDLTLEHHENSPRYEPQSDSTITSQVLFGHTIKLSTTQNNFEIAADTNSVDNDTFEAHGIFLCDDECEAITAEKMPTREDCSHALTIKCNKDLPSYKKSRKRRREHEDCDSTRARSKLARSVSAQFMDCKTKNAITRGRHNNVDNNVLACTPNQYYKKLDIIDLSEDQTQLQTTCHCGRIRPFVRRRAIKKGTAMTYFAAERCACDPKHTNQLRICFCGALFRSAASMYKCPCFGKSGPGFARFPEYARFAPRRCFCPHERRHCSCLMSHV